MDDAHPSVLRLEVPEDAIGPAQLPPLRALARLGVSLAVDGFGAGGAAFAHVARVPGLTEIKVDRSLGQGFWFGRPQPAAEVEQLLRRAAHGELGI